MPRRGCAPVHSGGAGSRRNQRHRLRQQQQARFSIPPEIADPPQKGAGGKPRRPRKSAKNKLRSRAQKLLQADGEADGDPAAEEPVASLAPLLPDESELASRAARAQLLETAGAMYVANQSAWGALALGLSHGSPLAPLLFGINASAPLPAPL